MSRPIVLRQVASQEFEESISWYETAREGLGLEFRKAVEQCFARIGANPEHFPGVRGDVQRAVVPRFPFVIHFFCERDQIVILSVFHTSRDPQRWKRRR